MITAVDSNVLLDVFGSDPTFAKRSSAALRSCIAEGGLIASEVVWAEIAGVFPTGSEATTALERLGVRFSPMTQRASMMAGATWRMYRARGGRRNRLIADFLVGAHALEQADRLLTRDRGFYKTAFKKLTILDPTARAG